VKLLPAQGAISRWCADGRPAAAAKRLLPLRRRSAQPDPTPAAVLDRLVTGKGAAEACYAAGCFATTLPRY
jgi:hypothetical protein